MSELVQKSSDYVFHLFKEKLLPQYVYHNYTHTAEVARAAEQIGRGSNLGHEELEMVLIAAWFHDLGTIEVYRGHEEASSRMAEEFLHTQQYPADRIEQVKSCIMATRMPQHPKNLLEEIICDADLAALGNRNYEFRNSLLRLEWQKVLNKFYSDQEWHQKEVDFLMHHRYFTQFAQVEFQEQKNRNLLALEQRLREEGETAEKKKKKKDEKKKKKKEESAALPVEKEPHSPQEVIPAGEPEEVAAAGEEAKKVKKPDRGIETMFKITSQNHMELSAMADNKANIMISVNTIVISIVVTGLLPKLDTNPYMIFPAFMLLIVCLSAIIFSTLATRPNITGGKFTSEDVKQRKVNLLFFGNFYNMELPQYQMGMKEMLNDRDFLYGSLTKDIYFLGIVLGRKYQYLRWSYLIFMYGLIVCVIAFVIAFVLWKYQHPEAMVPFK